MSVGCRRALVDGGGAGLAPASSWSRTRSQAGCRNEDRSSGGAGYGRGRALQRRSRWQMVLQPVVCFVLMWMVVMSAACAASVGRGARPRPWRGVTVIKRMLPLTRAAGGIFSGPGSARGGPTLRSDRRSRRAVGPPHRPETTCSRRGLRPRRRRHLRHRDDRRRRARQHRRRARPVTSGDRRSSRDRSRSWPGRPRFSRAPSCGSTSSSSAAGSTRRATSCRGASTSSSARPASSIASAARAVADGRSPARTLDCPGVEWVWVVVAVMFLMSLLLCLVFMDSVRSAPAPSRRGPSARS